MRYATAERFDLPVPVPFGSARSGVAAPQPGSRLDRVTGPAVLPQSEDCLLLTGWAPPDAAGLPVLVFLHGGGFSSGSGELPWYDGALLAERGRMVVITVNYRLGALGFAQLAGAPGNLGLRDLLTALRWVREHAARFGGDPERITVAGQSAGALCIAALLAGGRAPGLFRRAILQSMPGGVRPHPADTAAELSALLLRTLGVTDPALLRTAPVADVLAGQLEVARQAGLGVTPPFQLTADGDLVGADPVHTAGERGADGIPILLTFTRHEGRAFVPDPAEPVTEQYFLGPGREFADLLTRRGNPPQWYEFDWAPPGNPLGACHCIDLPFVFGTLDAWRDAPMLAGADPGDLAGLVEQVQSRWIGFVHGA